MAVISRINPNFPLPGIDQPSKGFRDNFTVIKSEIEALQGKKIQLVGEVTSIPVMLDSGSGVVAIPTVTKIFRQNFTFGTLVGGILTVTHNLGQQFVIVQISNELYQVVAVDSITLTNTNTVTIDLTSYGAITGTWCVVVRG